MSATETPAPLVVERADGIVTLRLNRPRALNAIDVAMACALRDAVRSLVADPTVRAVVLCGAGKGFAAGGDLAALRLNPVQAAADLLGPLNETLVLLGQLNAPVIAKVHGVAAGAGLSLMMQADFVVAAQGTRFNLAYINLGTSCDVGASWSLPRLVGLRKALEIAMLGETLSTDDALRLGLINQVAEASLLDEETAALAQKLATGPTLAYGAMRRLMRGSFDRDLASQLNAETAAFTQCMRTQDFARGVEAFYNKQKPVFEGN